MFSEEQLIQHAAMGAPGLHPRHYAAAAARRNDPADQTLAELATAHAKKHSVSYHEALLAVGRSCPALCRAYADRGYAQ